MSEVDRVAIVTGAGSGIGRECAVRFAGLGWGVALVGRTRATLEGTAAACGGEGATRIVVADVGVAADCKRVVESAIEGFGRIDALVNNAGMAVCKPFFRFTDAEVEATFQVNALGPIRLMNRAWEHLVASGSGRVVNVSSYAALDPFSGLGVYGAAKASLNLMGKAAAREAGESGVRVFSVAPGAVETGMLRAIFGQDVLPTAQTLDPGEVARVIVACASGQRDHEAGAVIPLASP